ncbi:hypothetical protein M422DRAFT_776286 [Sphaerobolus stellatus SS14]|nr:hypothetical protein M422DRAFT_776286 [Sphaerobolus stellatus SS14]
MSNPSNGIPILTNAPRIHCIPLPDVPTPISAVGAYSASRKIASHKPPLSPPRFSTSLNALTAVRPAAARIAGPTYAPRMRSISLPNVSGCSSELPYDAPTPFYSSKYADCTSPCPDSNRNRSQCASDATDPITRRLNVDYDPCWSLCVSLGSVFRRRCSLEESRALEASGVAQDDDIRRSEGRVGYIALKRDQPAFLISECIMHYFR